MSKPFELSIGGATYRALPPSFAFQRQHREEMRQLEVGTLAQTDAQDFIARHVIHCIQRAMPDLDVAALEERLDAIEIARASAAIGAETHRQVAQAYGVDSLGEAAGKA